MKTSQRFVFGIVFTVIAMCVVSLFIPEPPRVHAGSQFANILCDNFKPVSIAVDTTLITAPNANMFIYVCSYNLVSGVANNVSIVEGTGTVCATGLAAMVGSTTAANGLNLAANGSINYGGGSGAVTRTAVAGDNVCILRSSAGPLSGVIGWTALPF